MLMTSLWPSRPEWICQWVVSSRVRLAPWAVSFDYLIGARKHARRYVEAKRLRGLEIEHRLKLGRSLHWQVSRLLAFEDAIDIAGNTAVRVTKNGPVGD